MEKNKITGEEFVKRLIDNTIVKNLIVTTDVFLNGVVIKTHRDFKNTIFKERVLLKDSIFNSIDWGYSTVLGNILGGDSKIKNGLDFRNLTVEGRIRMENHPKLARSFHMWYTTDKKLQVDWRKL